ncbi:MAG: ABC transporter ATP-binding protein [Erysipelotrichaceae bacterium]|nr:ABC transporter ATP-binding protein [Erysipelotrichaceae bacterium]
MLKLFKFLRKRDWFLLIVIFGLIVTSVYLELKMPDFMIDITKLLQTPNSEISDIWIAGAKMLGCALGSAVVSTITGFISSYISSSLSKTLRKEIYDKVESMSARDIERFSTASLITRATNDVSQIQMIFSMGLSILLKAPVMAVWAIIKIVDKGTTGWVIATGVAVGVLVIVISIAISYALPKFKIVQKQIDDVNLIARENINGLRVIKAFNAEEKRSKEFESVNKNLTKTNTGIGLIMAIMNPLMSGIMSGLTLSIYWIGAYAINSASEIPDKFNLFANMLVFSSYSMQVVMAFMLLIIIFMIMPRAVVSGRRISEVIFSNVSIKEGNSDGNTDLTGEVEFKNVSFSYDGDTTHEKIIDNATFKVTKGQTLAIIGATGSGKSTLANLAVRYYDATDGEILVDGTNVKDYRFESLYNRISIVPQKAVMFSGTIEENILYGNSKGGSLDDLKKAINVSQAAEFIEKKEGGISSQIEQGGKNLSGGQKQRIAIARALARNPEIIIFDDSFSALDYKTDFTLRNELSKQYPGLTKIIIAQRVGTIKNADEILVVDNGKIVGKGKHEELLISCPIYKEIALSQLSEEELLNA